MSPNDADGIANSEDPDQTVPLEAVWSGSALFAQTCLSGNLGSLQYFKFYIIGRNSCKHTVQTQNRRHLNAASGLQCLPRSF